LNKDFIDKCRKGDKIALEQLYNHYAPKMKAICLRYVYSIYEAEDIFQDAFIKVLKNIKQYNYKGSFDGWVRKIVVHTAIDHCKQNLVYKGNIPCEEAEETEADSFDLANQLSANELLNIIKKIPPGYNLVFNLYAIEGYTHPEIAKMLGISESSSRSQLCKARSFIKNILKQYDFAIDEKKTQR
jgi:RNA polymerase sigma-70 factor (ECF subfamily)